MGSLLQSSQARLPPLWVPAGTTGGGQGMCTPKGLRKLSWGAARNCAAAPLQKEQGTARIPWGAGGADAPQLTPWHGGDALPQFPSPAAPTCPQFPPLLTLLSRCCSRHLKHRGRSLGSSSRVQGRSRVCLSHLLPPSPPCPSQLTYPSRSILTPRRTQAKWFYPSN